MDARQPGRRASPGSAGGASPSRGSPSVVVGSLVPPAMSIAPPSSAIRDRPKRRFQPASGSVRPRPAARRAPSEAITRISTRPMTPVIGTSTRASGSSSSEPGRGAPGGCGGSDPTTSNEGFGCGPVQPDGSGPAGAGRGPYWAGAIGVQLGQPVALEPGHVHAEGRLERLVVGHPVVVRADQLHEGVLAVGADDPVDGGHALGVGEEEPVAARRERAGEAVERASGCRRAPRPRPAGDPRWRSRPPRRPRGPRSASAPGRGTGCRPRPGRRRGSARGGRRSRPSSRRSRPGVIRANSVRMSGWASPPTFSRVPGPRAS